MICPESHSGSVIEALAPDLWSCPWLFQPSALPPHTFPRIKNRPFQGSSAATIQTVLQWSMSGGALPGCLPAVPTCQGIGCVPWVLSQPMFCFQLQLQDPPSSPVGLRVSLVIPPLPMGQSWLYWKGSGTWHLSHSL